MPEIAETQRVEAKADDLWRKVGKFSAVGAWHSMLANIDSEGDCEGVDESPKREMAVGRRIGWSNLRRRSISTGIE
jgi:hypothetical protein